MKTSIFILCTMLSSFGVAALGYLNWAKPEPAPISCSKTTVASESDFVSNLYVKPAPELIYNIDSRYIANITKEKLRNATTIIDLVPVGSTEGLSDYETVQVVLIEEEGDIERVGTSEVLNKYQKDLLSQADYGSNFYINAYCRLKDEAYGVDRNHKLVYFISVMPEHEAEYSEGQDALINYLKSNSRKETLVINEDKLKAGKFRFTVSQSGAIKDVKMESTSGYPSVDEKLLDLLANIPGKWKAASNEKGEAIEQEFVFFFGKQGC